MKTLLCLTLLASMPLIVAAQTKTPVMAQTTGMILAPTNFLDSNILSGANITKSKDQYGRITLDADFTAPSNALQSTKVDIQKGVANSLSSTNQTNLEGSYFPYLTASRPLVLNSAGQATNAAGTPDGTKFLRDDGSLAVPAGTVTTAYDNLVLTNGINHIRRLIPSTTTTQQIDVSGGPEYFYWNNMVTNVVLQITNVWVAAVTNRTVNFFFTGATNNGPNYTVNFTCPNPSGFVFRWGLYSATNGATSFTVTNNTGVGCSLTLWDTNMAEAYFSPTR